MNFVTINNHQHIPVNTIPELDYPAFLQLNTGLLDQHPERHCVTYFGYMADKRMKLICCIADDFQHNILVSSTQVNPDDKLNSFSAVNLNFEKFERELHENFGIKYTDHPWLKPVRYAFNRADQSQTIANYPFFSIDSEELHEVGVGPVHAGVIEPGHFRFICNGEQILHMEIQLGFQHRGVEQLFINKKKLLQRVTLAENIAGDSVAAHTSAFCYLWETLCDATPDYAIHFARTLAQELERMAIHTGDISAACTDVAYQLGSAVLGRLRTPLINFFQEWCGNRLAKGLIRPATDQYPFNDQLALRLKEIFKSFEPDFDEINQKIFNLPSALSRFERTGVVSYEQVLTIGAVGMAAKINNLNRDIRQSHPYGLYPELKHEPFIKHHGDVYSRVQLRRQEVKQSMKYILQMLENLPEKHEQKNPGKPAPDSFVLSMTEGWRGEICHAAITDSNGEFKVYKIKDPSFHNWTALALAVRNNEISDFPICNKTFDLSYCGHDL
jgi:Ni,Fe-hydrogenase III large subunit